MATPSPRSTSRGSGDQPVDHLAEYVGEGFSRFFNRHMGQTFSSYVDATRVGAACRALIDSDEPITKIAFDAGFGSLTNFNRRFRAARGVTPREFRRLHRSPDRR